MPRLDIQRSTRIHAPADQVFAAVADFHTWGAWSPWLCAEPGAKVTITQNATDVGAIYKWDGTVVGAGEVEHKQLVPGKLVDDELRIIRPWKSTSKTAFHLEESNGRTDVSWDMHGSLPWFLFWMKGQMESLIGMDYERGLSMLKEYVETGSVITKCEVVGVQSVGPLKIAGVRRSCSFQEVGASMQAACGDAGKRLAEHGVSTEGEIASVYHHTDFKGRTFDYTCGWIVPAETPSLPPSISVVEIPRTKAFCVNHVGRYEHLGNAWSTGMQHLQAKKLKQSKVPPFEIYQNNPETTPVEELLTQIMIPVK